MIVIPHRLYGQQDNKQMSTLVNPDGNSTWAVRYLWIQHLDDNTTFYNNYFDPDLSKAGMNVRKQTANLKSDWLAHNQIFFDSAANGDLVWRVKIGNPTSCSIDYIEVWRSVDVLEHYFGDSPKTSNLFHSSLYEAGFDIRTWYPYNTISKELALEYYSKFVAKHDNKDQCIINTPWNKLLNPT